MSGLNRAQARTLLDERDGIQWRLERSPGERGDPISVLPLQEKNGNDGANHVPAEANKNAAAEGPRYPKVFLLRLKQLQRGQWVPFQNENNE